MLSSRGTPWNGLRVPYNYPNVINLRVTVGRLLPWVGWGKRGRQALEDGELCSPPSGEGACAHAIRGGYNSA